MATRSLTEVFILMRNNAVQSRHIFSEQADDRVALVSKDPEAGLTNSRINKLPPEWVDGVEEIQYEISRIQQKIKEVSTLHDKHLNRPTMDDSIDEEHAIEIMTQDITQMFTRCHRLVQQIGARSRSATSQEQRVTRNVMSSLASQLQSLSGNFRQSQSAYLKRLTGREERYFEHFDISLPQSSSMMLEDEELQERYDRGFTSQQMKFAEDNSVLVSQREQEIALVVKSIAEVNEIFKDLAQIVADQGTVLDRIDYNIEHASESVKEGLQQLQKADKYQKKNRKMMCILLLAVAVIVLLIILIWKKS
ncbi:PREDICTED: syntaxin-16-like isoform X2 [Priapulus caudatus]|uniref:Syntaxin-16-like isoform X2 n=1 Tax=Priapulus caudatus TaxID=37621 RepID=A0ABM1EZK0_PRICU|nr:PREDICTED: syntaxin-16-like isoform X2 [Priapulus caudatus]